MFKWIGLVVIVGGAVVAAARGAGPGAGTRPVEGAAEMYLRAAGAIRVASPSETDVADGGPHVAKWAALAKAAREANGPMFELARRARSLGEAVWPADPAYAYRLPVHRVVNELNDAALYEHARGRHAEAVELVRDAIHLCDLLKGKPSRDLVRLLTASSYQGTVLRRLLAIAGSAPVVSGKEAEGGAGVRAEAMRDLMNVLLDQREPEANLIEIFGPPGKAWVDETWTPEQAMRTLARANRERTVAAMAVACRLFQAERGRWPGSVEDLVPDYLPRREVAGRADAAEVFREGLRAVDRGAL